MILDADMKVNQKTAWLYHTVTRQGQQCAHVGKVDFLPQSRFGLLLITVSRITSPK